MSLFVALVTPLPGCDALRRFLEPAPSPGPAFVLLLPEEPSGWTCVDFGVEDAPGLPREGAAWLIDASARSLLRTSSRPEGLGMLYPEQVYGLSGGERRALPRGVTLRRATSDTSSNSPLSRHCVFYGTEDQARGMSDAPELERLAPDCSRPAASATPQQVR